MAAKEFVVSPAFLLQALRNYFYKALRGGATVPGRGTRLLFDAAECGFATDLFIPAQDVWTARTRDRPMLEVEHEGEKILISSPSFEEIRATLKQTTKVPESIMPLAATRKLLDTEIRKVLDRHGISSPIFPRSPVAGSATFEEDTQVIQKLFIPWYEQFLNLFPGESEPQKTIIANLVRECGSMANLIIETESAFIRYEERRLGEMPPGLKKYEFSIQTMKEEIVFILRLLDIYHWEYDVLPGADERTGVFLPPEPTGAARARGEAGGAEAAQDPPILQPAALAAPPPISASPLLFGDLQSVPLNDDELQHRRYQFYIQQLGCKLVVVSPDNHFYCFLVQATDANRTMVIFVEPTRKFLGHAALAAFSCGAPGSPPAVLKQWLSDIQWPRPRLRRQGAALAPSLFAYFDHDTVDLDGEIKEIWRDRVLKLVRPPVVMAPSSLP